LTLTPQIIPVLSDDFSTNHNGFVSFYLCDVSGTPDHDIKDDLQFWKENCQELERSPHPSCESGNDKTCGPIDPKYPGRWVVPCRDPGAEDQVLGGPNGKMAYKIPNKEIKQGVIQAYWLTQNTCSSPDGFMASYKYPTAWAGCPGDGGSIGAKPSQSSCTKTGETPEEFFNCADVHVSAGGSSSSAPVSDNTSDSPKPSKSGAANSADSKTTAPTSSDATTSPTSTSKTSPGDSMYPSPTSDMNNSNGGSTTKSPSTSTKGQRGSPSRGNTRPPQQRGRYSRGSLNMVHRAARDPKLSMESQ
jgi:Lytic polysaccharide mono-oxygenase, cellulose-degrading